jgi:hypothetical protein
MPRRTRGRLSPREHKLAVNAAMRFYGMNDLQTEVKPLRRRSTPGADGRPLERHVLKAVLGALRADPRVARVERNQSGVFQDGERFVRVGSKGKLDLTIYLKDGRYIEAEVKREPNVTLLSEAQKKRIQDIRRAGGMAGWCWSVESAIALLPNG